MKRKPVRDVLATNLRRLMDAHATLDTQMRLASRSGVAQRTVGRMLNAEVDAQLGHVQAVAEALGVGVPALLTDHANQPADLRYDRERLAKLPAEERAKIEAFIEFILATHAGIGPGNSTLAFSETIKPTPAQREMVSQVAQRQLSNKTLTLDEDQTNPKGGKRGRR